MRGHDSNYPIGIIRYDGHKKQFILSWDASHSLISQHDNKQIEEQLQQLRNEIREKRPKKERFIVSLPQLFNEFCRQQEELTDLQAIVGQQQETIKQQQETITQLVTNYNSLVEYINTHVPSKV
jgi:ABC-type transporter Mla subunit MlaD